MLDGVTLICFLASYAAALGLELLYQFRRREALRWLAFGFGAAGLLAQTLFLDAKHPPLIGQYGWMLFLAWILAIFYLFGAVHHRRLSWGLFALPLVIGFVALGAAFHRPADGQPSPIQGSWGAVHAMLLLLAAVGLCVGFLASSMYLVQAHRLRAKTLPGQGLRLWSLERLEAMNRRAIVWAFPLLTAGLLLGLVLMRQDHLAGWSDPRLLGSVALWMTFAALLYLRYGRRLRGRPAALWTIVTFVLLVGCLVLSHPLGQGGGR